MDRPLFDDIFDFILGEIFLLNLIDSMELALIEKSSYGDFLQQLSAVTERNTEGWWRDALQATILASKQPGFKGMEHFSSILALNESDLQRLDGESELRGASPDEARLLTDKFLRNILVSRLQKKLYWLTDRRCLVSRKTADQVRDRLGLDLVDDMMHLFRIDLKPQRVIKAQPRRPSALCDGTPRFRVRRHDEAGHLRFKDWGRTVDLDAWRKRSFGSAIAGAAELISDIGPLSPADGINISYLGKTQNPAQCSDQEDHESFAAYLNNGKRVDRDSLYRRLTTLERTLT